MNELERHEAAVSIGGSRTGKGSQSGSDLHGADKGAMDDIGAATESAKAKLRDAQRSASDAYDDASSSAKRVYRSASRKVDDLRRHAPSSPEEARRAISDFVDSNPVMVAVIGVAAGLIAGALLPGTQRENQTFGRYADDVKDQGLRYARDLAEQGRHYVEESLDSAKAHAQAET